MSLGGHLIELRKRITRAALGILAGAVVGWLLSEPVLDALRVPIGRIAEAQGRTSELNFTTISEAFDLRMQIAITVGVVVASPVWLYQIWAFFMPGLTRREKRFALGFVAAAVPLFLAGCAAGWFVLPNMVALLTSFAPADSAAIISAKGYYDFVLKLVVAIGIAFVLPVFLVLLNFAGVLSARSILGSWRVAILVVILFTAVATPAADVMSMFLLAVPMMALYFVAGFIAWIHDRRARKASDRLDQELAGLR
ncbi:twin-arginine translocase subunit TatC [Cryobacterium sp. SO2]|uniref:twin-arginine translocase subunit TatC n=1 Tax=Cryobacterium sp. SO2 TaxID=1897060 RepID=UPI00223D98FF|nr:twin-arginine translocase subunit TatC [Cryobacterium sp. SO2]WEO79343.1 twin-arginine translocase subunit TatC [Cryobacterium sp. SO2]